MKASKSHTAIKAMWGHHLECISSLDGIDCKLFNKEGEYVFISITHDMMREWVQARGMVGEYSHYYEYVEDIPDKHIYQFLDAHPNYFTQNAIMP